MNRVYKMFYINISTKNSMDAIVIYEYPSCQMNYGTFLIGFQEMNSDMEI